MDDQLFEETWKRAFTDGKILFPDNVVKQREFTASVTYLVTGAFAGSPTVREHLVSYLIGLQGDGLQVDAPLTVFKPDKRFKMSGEFSYDEAVSFVKPLLIASLDNYKRLLPAICRNEFCFNNDKADLQQLKEMGLTIRQ